MPFSMDDELTWRVTLDNPVREVDGMDWERCAALHNLIIRLGWASSGRPESEMPRQTWWQKHITDQVLEIEWSTRLSPSLKLFFQSALQAPTDQCLFYYASNLSWPGQLFSPMLEDMEIMTLYQIPNFNSSGHADGLNFDQEISRAIFHKDILDSFITTNGRVEWDPLEVVLSAWLDMIDTGKIVAKSQSTRTRGPYETIPWEMIPYSQNDLQNAVNYFDNLILTIECLLENPSLNASDTEEDQANLLSLVAAKFEISRSREEFGLVSKEVLDAAAIPEGFIRDFLTSVRKPQPGIKYIAPGLRLPTPQDFAPHPLQNFQLPDSYRDQDLILPVPLFLSDTVSQTPIFEHYPFNTALNLPCGVWTTLIDRGSSHIFEDAVTLFLPFEIGGNGFACRTDGSLIGENQEDKGGARASARKDELYQPGYNHFIPGHGPQLGDVLSS